MTTLELLHYEFKRLHINAIIVYPYSEKHIKEYMLWPVEKFRRIWINQISFDKTFKEILKE